MLVKLDEELRYASHVAGIAAGNGYRSRGEYMGIAPDANIIAIKILDKEGKGNSADVLAGLQWMIDNKDLYNIKIANLSIGTADIGSKDPLVRAVDQAWSDGVLMVIAAGNNGPDFNSITSPGISRKALTVGASDDNIKVFIKGDAVENFSGRGPTSECIKKPDIVAPGADIISCLTTSLGATGSMPGKKVSRYYLQLSGTSMATPIVSGGIALLLEKYPKLKPDDIKYMLKKTAESLNYSHNQQGWGLIDLEKLINEEEKHVR